MTTYDDATIARFWSKVARGAPDECWEWQGDRNERGYGRIKVRRPRRDVRAHVFAHQVEIGPTSGLLVCHRCDNPPCCNPAHLWLGTNDENMADMVAKGRAARQEAKGEKNGNCRLTADAVIAIRQQIAGGDTNIEIADRFGVTHSMISRIRLKKAWTHLPD